ncbi:hypothetical protein G7Y79_00004g013440 [Physcia stellaris]|nr:hypothetical protein G7Y79_00004g013440 [Physcia stellaris]
MAMAVGNHYTAREVTTHPIPALRIGPNHNNHTTRPSQSNLEFIGYAAQWQDFENNVRRTFQQVNWNAGTLKSNPHFKSPLQVLNTDLFFWVLRISTYISKTRTEQPVDDLGQTSPTSSSEKRVALTQHKLHFISTLLFVPDD